MKIAIAGPSHAGLPNVVRLAQDNEVITIDMAPEKVEMLNHRQSPIEDAEIEGYLKHKTLDFRATLGKQKGYGRAGYVITDDIRDATDRIYSRDFLGED